MSLTNSKSELSHHSNRSWFAPTHFDALALAIVYCLIFTVLSVGASRSNFDSLNLEPFLLPLLGVLFGFSIAAGGASGLRRISWPRSLVLFLFISAGFCIYFFGGTFVCSGFPASLKEELLAQNTNGLNQDWEMLPVLSLLTPLAGFLVGFLIVVGVQLGSRLGKRLGQNFKAHSTRNLIALAVFLFVLSVLQKVFSSRINALAAQFLPVDVFESTPSAIFLFVAMAIYLTFLLAIVVILVYVPTRLGTNCRWFKITFPVTTIVSFLFLGSSIPIFILIDDPSHNSLTLTFTLAIISTPIFFYLSLLAIGNPKPLQSTPSIHLCRNGLSIWTALLSLPLLAFTIWAIAKYDIGFLTSNVVTTGKLSTESLKQAQQARHLYRQSNGFINTFWDSGRIVHVRFEAGNESDSDLLRLLSQNETPPALLIVENMQPYAWTSSIQFYGQRISLIGGELSGKQFADLTQMGGFVFASGTKMPTERDSSLKSIPSIAFRNDKNAPMQIAEFLNSHITSKNASQISFQSPIQPEDWDAIVRASQFRPVILTRVLPPQSILAQSPDPNVSLKNISLYIEGNPMTNKPLASFLLNSDINVYTWGRVDDKRPWDLAFGLQFANLNLYQQTNLNPPRTVSEFLEVANQNNWTYASNENQGPTMCWLPQVGLVDQFPAAFLSVTTLRMDRHKIIHRDLTPASGVVDYTPLVNLTNLEKLYLPARVPNNDLRFLAGLKKLTHLQIQSQDRSVQPGSGFQACTQLEKLVMFGTPDAQTIAELSKLKKLTHISIVDEEATYTDNPTETEKLRKRFPNALVEIIEPTDFEPELSAEFRLHVAKIRARLLDRVNQ